MSAAALSDDNPAAPVPVILLTGFLGAGKTSLLNRLLRSSELADSGFIINEFGAVGIDDQLVETADESAVELMNGCLCCTIKGDLPDTLAAMLARGSAYGRRLKRIIIETTGLADPAPIMQAILAAPFLQPHLYLQQVITVLDTAQTEQTLTAYAEARRQIAFADKIVLSKLDLLHNNSALPQLKQMIKRLNSAAEILAPPADKIDSAAQAEFCRQVIEFSPAPRHAAEAAAAEEKHEHHHDHEASGHGHNEDGHAHGGEAHAHEAEDHAAHHHHHDINRHNETIYSFTLSAAEPLPLSRAEYFAWWLSDYFGRRILRLKGIIDTGAAAQNAGSAGIAAQGGAHNEGGAGGAHNEGRAGGAENSRYYSLQAVQGRVFPPQIFRPRHADSAPQGSQIVIIADGAPEALSDNPLAVPGFKF